MYQGRFKCFPIQQDEHFLTACRYVEANAVRAGLSPRAEDWRWSSLSLRLGGPAPGRPALSPWPVDPPRDWLRQVNRPMQEANALAVRQCIARGTPLGSEAWKARIATRLGLDITLRPRGRPRKDRGISS